MWEKGGLNLTILYTLPNCGICNMIKTKLTEKNLSYTEQSFEKIGSKLNTDRAPVLQVNDIYYTSVTDMVKWIKEQ